MNSDFFFFFFFSSRRRHTRLTCDWSSDVCSSDLFKRLTARQRRIVLDGDGKQIAGVLPLLRGHAFYADTEEASASDGEPMVADAVRPYLTDRTCGDCAGTRLNPRARAVRVMDCTLPELVAMTVDECAAALERWRFGTREQQIVKDLL